MKKTVFVLALMFNLTAHGSDSNVFKIKNTSDTVSEVTVLCDSQECNLITFTYYDGTVLLEKVVNRLEAEALANQKLKMAHEYQFGELIMDPFKNEISVDFKNGDYFNAIGKSVFITPLWLVASPAVLMVETGMYVSNSHLEGKKEKKNAQYSLNLMKKASENLDNGINEIEMKEHQFSKVVNQLFDIERPRTSY